MYSKPAEDCVQAMSFVHGAEKLGENGISGSSNIVQVKNAAGTLHLKVHNLQSNIC